MFVGALPPDPVHLVDLLVVCAYLAATLAVGVWLARRVHSTEDFFLAGRRLPFWAIGMSLVVSDIGALEMVGGTAGAFETGIAQANFEWIGCVPAMVVGGLVFIPLFWRLGIHSIPEYLGQRYGPVIEGALAAVAIVFMAAALGVFFQASAAMFQGTLGWTRWTSIAVIVSIVAVYTVGGGLGAVVVTDAIQCTVLFVGGLTLCGLGLWAVGGPAGLRDGLAEMGERTAHHLELMQPNEDTGGLPWTGVLLGLGLVLSPAYWIGNQAIVQRTLGAKDAWHAKASMVFGAGLKTIVPLAFVVPGLIGVVLLRDRTALEPNGVYAALIQELLPIGVGLRGVLYAAFLAALMSSIDSYANSAATLFSRNLYRRFLVRDRDDRHYLRVGRITSFAILALGVAMVPVVDRFETIYAAFQSYLAFFQGPTLALILFGVLWPRATPFGGVCCLVAGIATSVALTAIGGVHYLHVAWWSFVASCLALPTASALGPKGGRP